MIITRINPTEVGISLRRANTITPHPNKCALTASRRHASPRTQPQTAGRRDFLDLKNRRSRSCASGAYLSVREDGSRTGSAIFVAKKRWKQPLINRTPRTQTDNSCVRRSRTSQTPRKLPPRKNRTYKIPNASPKGMHPHKQYKNVPNKNKRD